MICKHDHCKHDHRAVWFKKKKSQLEKEMKKELQIRNSLLSILQQLLNQYVDYRVQKEDEAVFCESFRSWQKRRT